MHCIVLVKQVPDVSNIPEEAWDREKGTLRRGVLDSVLNPLDLHALTLALELRQAEPAAGSRVLCLTMGPSQAKAILLDALARGADEAVLLTDRGFGGADTWPTAYIVVAGGRGLGAKARYERHLRALADAVAGALAGRVEFGASRMAVEDGFIGHDHQVGQACACTWRLGA